MDLSHPFDNAFRREVELMTEDSTLSDDALYNNAERYLQVLADPSCADIDQPPWVRRINNLPTRHITYTSSKLFDALYGTADAGLVLAGGRRYVSATVCVCAGRAERRVPAASLESEGGRRRIAEALSQLASTWIAFMLWPFFVDGMKSSEEVHTRPLCGPPIPEVTSTDNDRRWAIKECLLKRSGYICFMTGCVYSLAPRRFFEGEERVTISELRVTHILRPLSSLRELGMRADDEVVTSDILKHYRGPIDADNVDLTADGVTEARNALVMTADSCSAFSGFGWCLRPSRVADQYHVEVHERNWAGTQYAASPSPVTFEDHSHRFPASPANGSLSSRGSQRRTSDVDLPSTELLRVHAALTNVLQLSGAMSAFEAIRYLCESLDKACLPAASGSTFLQSVVSYEGREVCADVERLEIGAQKWEGSDSDFDPDWD